MATSSRSTPRHHDADGASAGLDLTSSDIVSLPYSETNQVHDGTIAITVRVGGATISPFKQRLIEQLGAEILGLPEDQLRADALETAAQAARRFICSRRVLNEWDEAVGPFYDTADLTVWLNKKHRMNLKHQVDRGEILAVKSGRTLLYPTFQFSRSGQPLPGLRRVLEVLSRYLSDPWDQALWLNSPIEDADHVGVTAATLMRNGHSEEVVRMAEADVERWAR